MRRRLSIVGYVFVIISICCFLFCSCGGSGGSGGDSDSDGDDSGSNDTEESSCGSDTSVVRNFTISVPLFASGSAWRQEVANASVVSASAQQQLVTYRVLLGDTSTLSSGAASSEWAFPDVTYDDYSIAISCMGDEEANIERIDYLGEIWESQKLISNNGTVTSPTPAGLIRPAGPQDTDADGHLALYNPTTNVEYDFWQPTTERDGSGDSLGGGREGTSILAAGFIDYFDTTGNGSNTDGYSSARATGVPLLAGLILPEDVASATISHALAFAIPGPRNTASDPTEPESSDYFYPTSTNEAEFYNTNSNALACGQRIRMKSTLVDEEGDAIDESELSPITRMFIVALRTYGGILVDNAGGFTFYSEDIHTANLDMTDDEINQLIGAASGTALESGKSKWQIVIEKLNLDLETIPFAYGSGTSTPATATITTANYEVVEAATAP